MWLTQVRLPDCRPTHFSSKRSFFLLFLLLLLHHLLVPCIPFHFSTLGHHPSYAMARASPRLAARSYGSIWHSERHEALEVQAHTQTPAPFNLKAL
ncbi:unnamed protein product [Taenia asiatica]|uniref:Secreted protein n=1 Tax=Taenia asiatica TaxID=60517 RepID=A0A0R3VXT7_TAEAS|nr:unnamed protein product [Taenia asiatica]